jgi:RimJ/RimL family protein N-acetyltransferase
MSLLTMYQATLEDLPFIMASERGEGYENLVGRWDEAQHSAAFADPRYRYIIGVMAENRIGFAMLRDWNSPEKVTLLKRIALHEPGQGHGRLFLRALIDLVFTQTDAYRFTLGLFPENMRARRAYEAAGFIAEGIARGSAFFGGTHRDEQIMAILRPDWLRPASR